jgi:hypothetical protein
VTVEFSFPLIVKPTRLSDHASRYGAKRGFSVAEVEEAIRSAPWRPAELGRLECEKDFAYAKEWNGKSYLTKRVRPVFVEEPSEIVVVTVYTYYF